MPRPEKVQAVEDIKQRIDAAPAVFLTEYRGLSVPEQEQLRAGLREAGAEYKVVKMTLAAIAARDLGLDELAEEMVGPTAIAFAGTDAVAAAKALTKFAEEHDVFVVKSGLLGGNVLAPEQVGELAKLPGREELLGKIAGAMAAPLFGAAGLFQAFTRNAAGMMSQLLEKKEAGDPVAGTAGAPAAAEEPEAAVAAEETAEEEADAPAEDAAAEETTDETTPAEAEADAETDPAAEADDPADGEEE
ncbi:MAG: 50S ribosomal protein L10 [Acidimicrobiia bacterium]|jgi:large subunit ribosomal protein L10|nr:MAG: 50S ribosomal protein L10 [Acidimicrobiia bacterium]